MCLWTYLFQFCQQEICRLEETLLQTMRGDSALIQAENNGLEAALNDV